MWSCAASSASSSLVTSPSQNRQQTVNYVSQTSSPTHFPPSSLTFSLCTPLPGSFVPLQTLGYFVPPMLEHNPLANAVSPTVLQRNGIHSLLTSITFNPLTPSKLLKTHFYKQYHKWFQILSSYSPLRFTLPHLLLHSFCAPMSVCVCLCVTVCGVWEIQ